METGLNTVHLKDGKCVYMYVYMHICTYVCTIIMMMMIIIIIMSDLADGGGKEMYDVFVRHSHHAVSVNLDDTMADSHAAALADATA